MSRPRSSLLVLLTCLAMSVATAAQQRGGYSVPRTEHGQPDFQGVWTTAFLTMVERPPGVQNLIASPEQAQALVTAIRSKTPAVIDPDFQLHDVKQLAMVKGEYRTSIIVDPADGQMPLSRAGLDLAKAVGARHEQADDIEQRSLADRCLENLGYAPMRSVPVLLPRLIVQTPDHVVIFSEDAVGLRLIHLRDRPRPDSLRTVEGYSTGRWEGDTLVVQTTHLRADDPARMVIGRPLVFSRDTRITERFTRVSPTELFYRFTIEDPGLYTRPWSGEFSMTWHDGPIYEYGCHEGNYSLPNILRGGQAEAARRAESKPDP